MAIHGLHDASTALLMMQSFGLHFRKPLVLLRAFVLEMAQTASGSIQIAPCCAARMTAQERGLLCAIIGADRDPALASHHLQQLCRSTATNSLLVTTQVLSRALAETGRPLVMPA